MNIEINPNVILFLSVLVLISLISSPLIMLLFLFLILLPGFILTKLFIKNIFSLPELLILSCGVGVAFIALITYLLKIFFIPLNSFTVFIIIISLILVFYKKELKTIKKIKIKYKKKFNLFSTILIIILFLGLFTRIYPINDMNAPLFADPAVSGTIARLIIDNQGIPDTWEPFLPIKINHQPGFASIVAWFNIFSGISIPKIILFLTNIFHGLLPLAIYFLSYQIFKKQFQSITASLISLIASFPTYVFIAGMNTGVLAYFLVPLAVGFSISCLKKIDYKNYFLIFLISIGAFLIHPLFGFFYVLLFGSYSLFYLFRSFNMKMLKKMSIIFSLSLIIPLLIVYPHFSGVKNSLAIEQWNLQSSYINPNKILLPSFFIEPIFVLFNNIGGFWYLYLESIPFLQLLFLYPIGIIMGFFFFYSIYSILKNKNKKPYLIFVWYMLFLFFSSIQSYFQFQFPFWEFIYPSRIKFLIIIPIALILSYVFSNNLKKFDYKKLPFNFIILLLILPFGLFLITEHLSEISQSPLSDYDLEAFSWLEKNTDKNSIILNTIRDVEAGAFIGGAGQWMPAVIGRQILFPATSLTDDILYPNIQERIKIMEYIENKNVNSVEFLNLLKQYNVNYVYISKNYMHSRNNFSPADYRIFLESQIYEPVFNNKDVYVFKVNYS